MDLRLDDPDPHVRDLAMIAFLDDVFGRGFLLRWARMNDCEERVERLLVELGEHPAVRQSKFSLGVAGRRAR